MKQIWIFLNGYFVCLLYRVTCTTYFATFSLLIRLPIIQVDIKVVGGGVEEVGLFNTSWGVPDKVYWEVVVTRKWQVLLVSTQVGFPKSELTLPARCSIHIDSDMQRIPLQLRPIFPFKKARLKQTDP